MCVCVCMYVEADPGFLKRGAHLRSTSKKGGPGGGPTLGPMLKSLQRGPKKGGGRPLERPPPPRIRPWYVWTEWMDGWMDPRMDPRKYVCMCVCTVYNTRWWWWWWWWWWLWWWPLTKKHHINVGQHQQIPLELPCEEPAVTSQPM